MILGFDLSTQSCKAVVFDSEAKEYVAEASVHFDTDLPHFGTKNGCVVGGDDGKRVTAPALMWAEALELCLNRLVSEFDLSKIKKISGAAQQHATVYWASIYHATS